MSRLADSQAAFAAAVLDPVRAIPENLGGPAGEDRFAIYRNNVMVGLINGLRDAYPVVRRLVGDEFFRAMAAAFARAHPPGSPVMLDYGAGFAEFIAGFPPAAGVPYLTDVARLERAWVEAYHATDARAIGDDFARARLELHPAVRLVRSSYPVLTILQANLGDGEPAPMELSDEGETVLIARPAAEVRACCVSGEAADAIEAVATGVPLDCLAGAHIEELVALGVFCRREAAA